MMDLTENLYRQGIFKGPEDTDTRRGHLQRRHHDRGYDTEGHGQLDGGQDQLRNSTQAFHYQGRRHNPGDEGRRHRGTGNPRRALGKRRILCQPLQQPVREERIVNQVKLMRDRFILNRSLSFQNFFVANTTIVLKSNIFNVVLTSLPYLLIYVSSANHIIPYRLKFNNYILFDNI